MIADASLTSPEARVALLAASALSGAQPHAAMTPEAMLLALLCDPAIRGDAGEPAADEEELRRVVLASDEKGDKDGWSERAKVCYQRMWKRAFDRGRQRSFTGAKLAVSPAKWGVALRPQAVLTVGDLLAGLAGSGPLVDKVLRRRALDPGWFDDEAGAPAPEVGELAGTPADAPVDVLAVNDDATAMDFVVSAFEAHFECTQWHALYLMYAVHERGRARIFRGPRAAAERRVTAAQETARTAGHPLTFLCGPRIGG